MGLDLGDLDLSDIDLSADDEEAVASVSDWFRGIIYLILTGIVIWVPQTPYYQTVGRNSWMFFALSFVGIVVGISGGRWLLGIAQRASARYARMNHDRGPSVYKPPTAVSRWLTLITGIGGGVAIVFGINASPATVGNSASFFIAIGAIAVGGTLGRWLLMQEHNPSKNRAPSEPIKLPPWFKWVTLASIAVASGFVLFSTEIFGPALAKQMEFVFGAIAFLISIVGAVWISKRFDEMEKEGQREREKRRPQP